MMNKDLPVGRMAGSLHSLGNGEGQVRMDGLFGTDIENLWTALTEPARLAQWVADIDGNLSVGGSFSATFTSGWTGSGVIDLCDRPRRLVATLAAGTDNETAVDATVTAQHDGTRLVVEESGIPLDEIGTRGASWQVHLEDLQHHIDGTARRDWRTQLSELAPAYEAMASELR